MHSIKFSISSGNVVAWFKGSWLNSYSVSLVILCSLVVTLVANGHWAPSYKVFFNDSFGYWKVPSYIKSKSSYKSLTVGSSYISLSYRMNIIPIVLKLSFKYRKEVIFTVTVFFPSKEEFPLILLSLPGDVFWDGLKIPNYLRHSYDTASQ